VVSAAKVVIGAVTAVICGRARRDRAPGGHVEVRWASPDHRSASLEVADDGPGVPEADRATIFKPYVTMRPKGVGLGLAIVAQIAAAHRWEVTCLPNQPHGAMFRFSHLIVASSPA
jgi:signal transduction histidine kinase